MASSQSSTREQLIHFASIWIQKQIIKARTELTSDTKDQIQEQYHGEIKHQEVQANRRKSRAEIQRDYRERQKKENGKLFLSKERERRKRRYVPISMLDEQSKALRRMKNREAVQRHRERMKTTEESNYHRGQAEGNIREGEDIQWNYGEQTNKEDWDFYLLKRRETRKGQYVPVSMLDEQSKAQRRMQNREAVRRHRERKKEVVKGNEELSEALRMQNRESVRRHRERKKEQAKGKEELSKAQRLQNREATQRYRERKRVQAIGNQELSEALRMRNREAVRRHRERKKLQAKGNEQQTKAQRRKQSRESIRHYTGEKKLTDEADLNDTDYDEDAEQPVFIKLDFNLPEERKISQGSDSGARANHEKKHKLQIVVEDLKRKSWGAAGKDSDKEVDRLQYG